MKLPDWAGGGGVITQQQLSDLEHKVAKSFENTHCGTKYFLISLKRVTIVFVKMMHTAIIKKKHTTSLSHTK